MSSKKSLRILGGVSTICVLACAGNAAGQNLFRAPMPAPATQPAAAEPAKQQPVAEQPATPSTTALPGPQQPTQQPGGQSPELPAQPVTGQSLMAPPTLQSVSLLAVIPPEARKYQIHDKIDIIVNETSNQKHEQKLDSKKSYALKAKLAQFPSLQDFIRDSQLRNGIGDEQPGVDLSNSNDYKGSGTYERKDTFTARIAATVIDVKPNGLLVIEARKTVTSDKEEQTIIISGVCDPKDITRSNTVQSAQLADLTIRSTHTGQVPDSSEKGFIPRLLEGIFSF